MILEVFWVIGLCWGSEWGHLLKSLASWTCTSASTASTVLHKSGLAAYPFHPFKTRRQKPATRHSKRPTIRHVCKINEWKEAKNSLRIYGDMVQMRDMLIISISKHVRQGSKVTDQVWGVCYWRIYHVWEHELSRFNNFWVFSQMHPNITSLLHSFWSCRQQVCSSWMFIKQSEIDWEWEKRAWHVESQNR